MEYRIQICDSGTLNVTVIDDPSILTKKLPNFISYLGNKRITGISLQNKWLYLCTATQCLMIDLNQYCPELHGVLFDETICFVALDSGTFIRNMNTSFRMRRSSYRLKDESCLGLGYLAGRVLKKPEMKSYKLEQLGAEVGVDIKPQLRTLTPDEWKDALFFTTEQMKSAVHEAYYCFLVASKLLAG